MKERVFGWKKKRERLQRFWMKLEIKFYLRVFLSFMVVTRKLKNLGKRARNWKPV